MRDGTYFLLLAGQLYAIVLIKRSSQVCLYTDFNGHLPVGYSLPGKSLRLSNSGVLHLVIADLLTV